MKHFALILLFCSLAFAQKGRPLRAVVCTGGGTASAATCSPSPALAALSDLSTTPRTIVLFTPTANNTGALTLAISGLAATAVKKYVGGAAQDPAADDLRASTSYWLEYDGTDFVIKSVLGNGGSGSSSGKYYQSWFMTRDYAGNRGAPFSTDNEGSDGFYEISAQGGTASAIQGFNVSTTANEKAGVSFRLPFTPSAWTFYIHGNSRSTSQVTFSVARSCSADGEAAATADNAATGSVTPAATNRYYVVPITMVLTGCASGEVARVVVSTTTTVNTDIIGLSTEVTP